LAGYSIIQEAKTQLNINIVWPTPDGDRILDRLAKMLAEHTGWPLNPRPVERVDLNYDMSYIDLAQRFTDWRRSPWAAYFSHYEPDTPYKRFWWETALPLTKIQTVTADQYGAMIPHPVKVIAPVDPIFEIRDRIQSRIKTIGVVGFVEKTDRKGAGLVARLAQNLDTAEIVASGDGWPAKHINRSLSGMPDFYRKLDLYLCTSLIEGVPMPPLEALASGIPVVIPRGVGMLDELPEIQGIYRFECGNYEDLLKIIQDALKFEHKPEQREELRASVANYTPEAWATSHIKGFERALEGKYTAQTFANLTHDRHGQRGVYYVAYGEPARKCAEGSIKSFKQFLPDIPVALVSNEPLGPEDVFIEHEDEDIGGRAAKVMIYDLAPADWGYIAYLDADTEIIAKSELLWQVVEDGWDMVICKNPSRFHIASQMRRSDNKDECDETFRQIGTDQLIQLNGGVFCFQRNMQTEVFFHTWEKEWRRHGKRDQAALLRSLHQHPIKLYVLGNEWNTITRYDNAESSAWLLHYPMTARRWRGVVHYRLDDPAAWKAVKDFERTSQK